MVPVNISDDALFYPNYSIAVDKFYVILKNKMYLKI